MVLSEAFLEWEQQTQERSKQEERREIALNMLRKHLDLETIAEVTGLTTDQIQHLQSQREQD
ncbi:MAG: hypothetical protein MUC48_19330 [Leptolyngbya sp. Prado105]|jgi:predicted HTH domain antitoxin|nr:hypothetical protein [Leptolyngbya sp. Prado105]